MSEFVLAAFQFAPKAGEVESNLAEVERGLRDAAAEGADLVCLPEMWATSFVDVGARASELVAATDAALASVSELSRELNLVVCGTSFGNSNVEGRLFNRLHLIDSGKCVTQYDKVHLFSPTAEPRHFVAGELPPRVAETRVGRVAGGTCYDLRFPETFRPAFRAGMQILCVPAQWPDARAAHWTSLAIARAVENQCFVIAGNRTGTVTLGRRGKQLTFPGNSLIVDPGGSVLAEGTADSKLITARVDLEDARRMRVHVPVEKDARPELYESWGSEPV